jgi:hypothetical protein
MKVARGTVLHGVARSLGDDLGIADEALREELGCDVSRRPATGIQPAPLAPVGKQPDLNYAPE